MVEPFEEPIISRLSAGRFAAILLMWSLASCQSTFPSSPNSQSSGSGRASDPFVGTWGSAWKHSRHGNCYSIKVLSPDHTFESYDEIPGVRAVLRATGRWSNRRGKLRFAQSTSTRDGMRTSLRTNEWSYSFSGSNSVRFGDVDWTRLSHDTHVPAEQLIAYLDPQNSRRNAPRTGLSLTEKAMGIMGGPQSSVRWNQRLREIPLRSDGRNTTGSCTV